MSKLAAYHVDHLFLLIGGNPLPNYVAARLLVRDQANSRIVLVCSKDTREEAAQRIEQLLHRDGFQKIEYCEVKESDPTHIYNQVQQQLKHREGSIGLHYTGGTKAMAVHAYQAFRDTVHQSAHYSYLDARSLALIVSSPAIAGGKPQVLHQIGKAIQPPLRLKDLLSLHGLDKLTKQSLQTKAIWQNTASALANLHSDPQRQADWRTWCQSSLRERDKKGGLVLKKSNKLTNVLIEDIPDQEVRDAFLHEHAQFTLKTSLTAAAQFTQESHPAKWFDGEWFEHHLLHILQPLVENRMLEELVMTVEPHIGASQFEFDVAALHGYQLFAFSLTTGGNELFKPKLLEAIVRAEQLGGSEVRVALVCCADPGTVQKLEQQIESLPHQSKLTKIFGRDDLLDLRAKIEDWIRESSKGVSDL
ncbi:MAG: hypothetical protein AB4911_19450 [Oscillochloridaceae bacterium umkhey_bin13]